MGKKSLKIVMGMIQNSESLFRENVFCLVKLAQKEDST